MCSGLSRREGELGLMEFGNRIQVLCCVDVFACVVWWIGREAAALCQGQSAKPKFEQPTIEPAACRSCLNLVRTHICSDHLLLRIY